MTLDQWIVLSLVVVVIGGHAIEVVLRRDDWPFSAYEMYAHLIRDYEHSPYCPLPALVEPGDVAALVLTATFPGGRRTLLTTSLFHPLVFPLDRREITLCMSSSLRTGGSVDVLLTGLLRMTVWRAVTYGVTPPIALEIALYKWRIADLRGQRHTPPDAIIAVAKVEADRCQYMDGSSTQ